MGTEFMKERTWNEENKRREGRTEGWRRRDGSFEAGNEEGRREKWTTREIDGRWYGFDA